MRILEDASEPRLAEAARIWAAATAARDGDPGPAPTDLARSRLDEVLAEAPDARLLTALDPAGSALGFALVRPSAAELPAALSYFAVRPDSWGRGVGVSLLRESERQLRSQGERAAELWVNQDNTAAIALYRRAGWRAQDATRVNERSGRTMLRFILDLR